MPSDYRLSPALAARLLGFSLVGWALLVLLATAVVVLFAAPVAVLSVAVVLCLVGVLAGGWWLTRRSWVVRLTEDGYRVRLVRGAGTTEARWRDVENASADHVAGAPCVVLRLRDGRSTTIPVDVLAGDREEFVRELQRHLQRGQWR